MFSDALTELCKSWEQFYNLRHFFKILKMPINRVFIYVSKHIPQS